MNVPLKQVMSVMKFLSEKEWKMNKVEIISPKRVVLDCSKLIFLALSLALVTVWGFVELVAIFKFSS